MKCNYCGTKIAENSYKVNFGGWDFYVCTKDCKEKLEKANLNRTRNLKLFFIPIIILLSCILISALFIKNVNCVSSLIMLSVAFLCGWLTFFPAPKPNHVRMFGYKKALLYNKLGTAVLALIFLACSIINFI